VHCVNEQELFLQVCRDSVRIGGMKMAWIGLIDTETQLVQPVASSGEDIEYLHDLGISIAPNNPKSRGAAGTAIHENRPVWCQDFLNDPMTSPWHERGARCGWHAVAVLPIHKNGVVIGVFNLVTNQVYAFDEAVQDLLVEMALNISFALDNFDREAKRKQAEESLQKSEQFLRTVIETEPECVKVVDRSGKLLEMNTAGLNMLEADTLDTVKQYTLLKFIVPEYRAAFIALHKRVIKGESGSLEFEVTGLRGTRRWLETYAAPLRDQTGNIAMMLAVTRDVTQHKYAETQLKLAAKVFEQSSEGFMITDADRNIVKVNHAFTVITGYSEIEALGQSADMLSSGLHNQDFYHGIREAIDAQNYWQGEIWNRRKNGEVYPELLNISVVRDNAGNISEYVSVFADISPLKASEAQLEFLAHHDPLTSLPNRLRLFYRLEHSIDAAKREGKQLALLMLDLDRFKDVNDSFGHLAGDQLLQLVANRLMTRLRNLDTVSRLGGDEFTVLLEDISHPENAARIAQTIISDLSEPWTLPNSLEVLIGVSIGISLYPQHGDTPELLLQHADAALYKAKESGRNCFAYFSDELTVTARERIELEARLRRAILQNELRVHYQPQIDIASGDIIGAEALVRWHDPLEGLIPPSRFIPVAEQTGLIMAIGAWVLKETCRQGKQWLDAGLKPLSLAVNVSPQQLRQGDISALVAEILLETRFPAEHLELELTESALMERQTDAIALLNKLRAQGVGLAIDDFGTGYSSLAYLKRFPLDVLKIDKSFIDDIPHQQDDMEIAATIIAMGHILGFKVLAEGVETQDQLAFLQAKGCDLYQGYLNSRPLPADDFTALLREASHK
jgi:diguanylate cyclase (GGDEF)-like protein/PAS domain S-box-containing protein